MLSLRKIRLKTMAFLLRLRLPFIRLASLPAVVGYDVLSLLLAVKVEGLVRSLFLRLHPRNLLVKRMMLSLLTMPLSMAFFIISNGILCVMGTFVNLSYPSPIDRSSCSFTTTIPYLGMLDVIKCTRPSAKNTTGKDCGVTVLTGCRLALRAHCLNPNEPKSATSSPYMSSRFSIGFLSTLSDPSLKAKTILLF